MQKLPFDLREGEKFLKDAPLVFYEGADSKRNTILGGIIPMPKKSHIYLTDQRLLLFESIGLGYLWLATGKEAGISGLIREIPLSSVSKITTGLRMPYDATIELQIKSEAHPEENVVLAFHDWQARKRYGPAIGLNPDAYRVTAKRADERDEFFEEIKSHSPLKEEVSKKASIPQTPKQGVPENSGKILQYKRTCRKCGKVWYSLVEREAKMEKESKSNLCLNLCSENCMPCRIILFTKVKKGQTLDKLRRCPKCQSPSYAEETLAYDEKDYGEKA